MDKDKQPVLELKGLTVKLPESADRENAIEDVSLAVHGQEIVCVVGESGSGKSVTAHTIMGLLPAGQLMPTAGEILFEGDDLLRKTPKQIRDLRGARMSMVFQEPMTALNPVMTVGRQIEEVLKIHTDLSPAKRMARVAKVMDDVRLPDPERLIGSYPHQLSGGQRQRVVIAAALVLEPVLLIADEPTTALDVTTQAQILKLIGEIQQVHSTAVLFITHDFGVVAEIADRVVVMQTGRVVEQGYAKELLVAPRHPYTRMLISSVPSVKLPERPSKDSNPIVLETKGLSKTYSSAGFFRKKHEVRAAESVEFHVRRGETVGIVGESGSRKSTVARCVVRLIEPSEGEILIDNLNIATLSSSRLHEHRRQVQIVFQDPYRSLNPRRTVGASIIEGPMNFGVSEEEALGRAKDLMELVDLDPGSLDRYPHQFSGGQRQRVCIARALAMEWSPRCWSPTKPCRRSTSRFRLRFSICSTMCARSSIWLCSLSPTTCEWRHRSATA
jgi:peptide/nickel transport system ATP-binding protein